MVTVSRIKSVSTNEKVVRGNEMGVIIKIAYIDRFVHQTVVIKAPVTENRVLFVVCK